MSRFGTNVLCARCPEQGRGCRQQLVGLFDYWDGKRAGRVFPARSDIDPLDLPALLPNLFLVDVLSGEPLFRYRLTGSNVDEIHGQSLAGKSPRDIRTPEVARQVEQQYRAVIETGQPRCDHLTLLARDDSYWHYERLLLPLSGDGRRINMLLGCIYET